MDARHTFTEQTPCYPLHASPVSEGDPDAPWYVRFSFSKFERDWNDTADQYAAKNEFFDGTMGAATARAKMAEWGCTADELPPSMRAALQIGGVWGSTLQGGRP